MALVKLPIPDPSVVFEPAIVGAVVVPQQTPLAVIAAPPSVAIVPPLVAAAEVIEVKAVVIMAANTTLVVKVTSFP